MSRFNFPLHKKINVKEGSVFMINKFKLFLVKTLKLSFIFLSVILVFIGSSWLTQKGMLTAADHIFAIPLALLLLIYKDDGAIFLAKMSVRVMLPIIYNLCIFVFNQNFPIVTTIMVVALMIVAEVMEGGTKQIKTQAIIVRALSLVIVFLFGVISAYENSPTTYWLCRFMNVERRYIAPCIPFICTLIQIDTEVLIRHIRNKETNKTRVMLWDIWSVIGMCGTVLLFNFFLYAGEWAIIIEAILPCYIVVFQGGKIKENAQDIPSRLMMSMLGTGVPAFSFTLHSQKILQEGYDFFETIIYETIKKVEQSLEAFVDKTYRRAHMRKNIIYKPARKFNYIKRVKETRKIYVYHWKLFTTWTYLKTKKIML